LDGVEDAFLCELVGQSCSVAGEEHALADDTLVASPETDLVAARRLDLGVRESEAVHIPPYGCFHAPGMLWWHDDPDRQQVLLREDPGVTPRPVAEVDVRPGAVV